MVFILGNLFSPTGLSSLLRPLAFWCHALPVGVCSLNVIMMMMMIISLIIIIMIMLSYFRK